MAQIFGPNSNTLARVSLAGAVICFFFLGAAIYAVYWSPYMTEVNVPRGQEVPFSHQHHYSGLGIDCRYCHTTVENSSFAGVPPTEICMSYHSQVWTDAPMLAPARQSQAADRPLQRNRVKGVRDMRDL